MTGNHKADRTLRQLSMFRSLAPEDLRQLADVSRIKRYGKGDVIFREGEPSDSFFSVVEGRVKVFKTTPSGQDVILEIFGANDPLGAVAVYQQQPYPASAVALDDVVCVSISSSALLRLLEGNPSIVRGFLVGLNHRLVELTRRISELTGGRVEHRLARLFLKLAEERGAPSEDGVFIPLPLSRQEVADLTGTTIETCIRIMSRWGKENLVRTEPEGFTVLDLRSLSAIARL